MNLALSLLYAAERAPGAEAVVEVGRDRARERGLDDKLEFVQANAESLPFPDNHFDAYTIAFGIRNLAGAGAGGRREAAARPAPAPGRAGRGSFSSAAPW